MASPSPRHEQKKIVISLGHTQAMWLGCKIAQHARGAEAEFVVLLLAFL